MKNKPYVKVVGNEVGNYEWQVILDGKVLREGSCGNHRNALNAGYRNLNYVLLELKRGSKWTSNLKQ